MQKIMIIEDEPGIRDELTLLLGNAGFTVLSVDQFNEIACPAADARPDLILLHLGLPGRDVFALCDQLRKRLSTPIL